MRPTDEVPSLAHRGSRDIHVAQPLDSLCSPCGSAFGCYSAALRFTTILFTLLKGEFGVACTFFVAEPKAKPKQRPATTAI
jgi:hypothetical protein